MSIVYGYFHNPCVFESAAALQSLHVTKAGAWRAMRVGMWNRAVRQREERLTHGAYRDDHPLAHEAFFIGPVRILP